MNKNVDIKFRLKFRKKFNPDTGTMDNITKNVLITMRILYKTMRMELSTGYHIDALRWDERTQLAIGPNRDGMSADEINLGILQLSRNVREATAIYDDQEIIPSADEFKNCLERIKEGTLDVQKLSPKNMNSSFPPITSKDDAELTAKVSPKRLKQLPKGALNKHLQIKKSDKLSKKLGFWAITHEFERQCGRQNNWSESTYEKFHAMRNHMKGLREYKRKMGLKTFDIDFDFFDEEGLMSYVEYLREVKGMMNSSIEKQLSFLRWFLRWTLNKRFHDNNTFETFRPKLKKTQKKVVYLTHDELKKLQNYKIPETKLYLYRVRDVFIFCCFTGLRHSDVYNLKRCDIKNDYIEVTTVKTSDSLKIELNDTSRRILEKYKHYVFPDDKALPVITNQKMNQYLHELCKLAGIDDQVRQTYYKGNERIDVVKPKYELIGTHTGRRTFICNAIGMGIIPQVVMKWTGHSDYKAMKPYIDIADEIKAESMRKFNSL